MDRDRVIELEDAIGAAITEVLADLHDERVADDQVVHLMAKAAVTILEAAEAASARR
ncbi:hypothetical protein OAG76_02660 [Rubripirellula sp.]|jgi:hypothetical protein|nr:hypothetical protein [Rubripirellula sp.]MDB4634285.1 hypothetical protein [Rubripirellula sp.]MDC0287868.1 hypothetical protein [Rubripirellula sp.]MDC0317235.1 hypothetical protein [bacterium]